MLHSSDLEPDRLRRLLADHIAQDQAREFRRYFLTRLAVIALAVWVLSWPIPLLPHTVLWALAASAALGMGLMSPSRTHVPTRDTTPTRQPRG
jgi:hypothetical protein